MIPINSTFAPLQVFVDELARFGMSHAVTCPGSRNAPLALTLAAHPQIEAVSVLDERSAGFLALGIAKEIGGGNPGGDTFTPRAGAANPMPGGGGGPETGNPPVGPEAGRPPGAGGAGGGEGRRPTQ